MISFNKSCLNQVHQHLLLCEDSFVPHLSSYVDIFEYSKKIFEKAYKIEWIVDNLLIGLLAFYYNFNEKKFFISNLSVWPSFQGRGIAQDLLRICKNECKKLSYESIKLEVFANNRKAINFYKKNGFVQREIINEILIMEWNNNEKL